MVREGQIVSYRLADEPDDNDARLRPRHGDSRIEGTVWRPAIVLRTWNSKDGKPPELNLRVLADGPAMEDSWRRTVPHIDKAETGQACWAFEAEDAPSRFYHGPKYESST